MNPGSGAALLRALAHAGFAACAALLLVAVGQPIFSDDAWWHLALGAAYAQQGPWLAEDPLLFTATGPPPPLSWLADRLLHAVVASGGFQALRAAHVALVAAILALVWRAARDAGRSALAGSAAAAGFAALSAYRLVQLRPELASIAGALLLYRALLADSGLPSLPRVLLCAAGIGLWANLHSGFALGLGLLAVAAAGLGLAAPLRSQAARAADRARAARVLLALALGALASLAHPSGSGIFREVLGAGSEMLGSGLVSDEWRPIDPLRWPVANLPPSLLSWAAVWALLLATPWAALRSVRSWRSGGAAGADPALLAIALVSLAAMLSASRFLWLGVFPCLLVLRAARGRAEGAPAPGLARSAAAAAAALALVPGFLRAGDWPMISRGIPTELASYAEPYPAAKYESHAVWLLRDAGLEGHLFGGYGAGGYLGYWLAPRLRLAWNGSLNLSAERMRANLALRERSGTAEEPDFAALLDAVGIDLFLGTGLPIGARANRPLAYTTVHLEGEPGWIQIFRSLRSALYLRANERNAANLRRIAEHYAAEAVPFDPERGFEPRAVIAGARAWATRHGLIPTDFERLSSGLSAQAPASERATLLDALAAIQMLLGLYADALDADEALLALAPGHPPALRRRICSLLHLGTPPALARLPAAAGALAARSGAGSPALELVAAARLAARQGGLPARERVRLPCLTPDDEQRLAIAMLRPPARLGRD